jgi:hypothetical protein
MSEVEIWKSKIEANGARFVPDYMVGGLVRYVCHGIPMGSAGHAILCNNLREAVECSDDANQAALVGWVKLLYSYAPSGCWGSVERVKAWIEKGGLAGIERAAAEQLAQ